MSCSICGYMKTDLIIMCYLMHANDFSYYYKISGTAAVMDDDAAVGDTEVSDAAAPEEVRDLEDSDIEVEHVPVPECPHDEGPSTISDTAGKCSCTVPCTPFGHRRVGAPCKACNMLSWNDFILNKCGISLQTAGGNCKSSNVVYFCVCLICYQKYGGKTKQKVHLRINGHRSTYKAYIFNGCQLPKQKHERLLITHLNEAHNICDPNGFDKHFKFVIVEQCSNADELHLREQEWIETIGSKNPDGMNVRNAIA